MKKLQLFVARYINGVSSHDLGEFKEGEPEFSAIQNKNIYTFSRNFEQVYNNAKYSGHYEIYTKVEGNVTNSYFIEYSNQDEILELYNKFKAWALK